MKRRASSLNHRRSHSHQSGIALFVVLTSILVISLLMKQLFFTSDSISERTRNSVDRIQAIYLARSALGLSRFFLMFSRVVSQQMQAKPTASASTSTGGSTAAPGAAVTLNDFWAKDIPFPIPFELVQAMNGSPDATAAPSASADASPSGSAKAEDSIEQKSAKADFMTKCQDFFGDFPGSAFSHTIDLNSRLNLNDLSKVGASPITDPMGTLISLLTPNPQFTQSLSSRGINYEELAREIRDFSAATNTIGETGTSIASAYTAAQLPYLPQQRPYELVDQLKLVPAVDNEVYDYLSPLVWGINIPGALNTPLKINLNTVQKQVFAALLKDLPGSDDLADKFLKDRSEKGTVYTSANAAATVQAVLGLDPTRIRASMLGGESQAFQIQTDATVNQVTVTLKTIVFRGPPTQKTVDPLGQIRVYP